MCLNNKLFFFQKGEISVSLMGQSLDSSLLSAIKYTVSNTLQYGDLFKLSMPCPLFTSIHFDAALLSFANSVITLLQTLAAITEVTVHK